MFKLFNQNRKSGRNYFLSLFTALLMPFMFAIRSFADEGEGGSPEDVALLEKVGKKIDEKSAEMLKQTQSELKKLAEDGRKGLLTNEEFEKQFKSVTDKLQDFDPEAYKKFTDKIDELNETIKKQGEEMTKLKDSGVGGEKPKTLKMQLEDIVDSDEYKAFADKPASNKASFQLKTVSVTSDYTGTSLVHITSRDPRVVDHPQVVRLNIRDLLRVQPTDMPYLAFTEVYSWVRSVTPTGENTALVASSFKIRESTTDAKRIGTYVPVSKRMLKSRAFVTGHLSVALPAQVRYNEDFQFLFGDGAGNNPQGIFNVATDFADSINASITGDAASVGSISTYNSGAETLVNFAANQLINNGDKITFANTTGGTYDNEYTAIVVGPRQIMIEQAYTADAGFANWTFTVNSQFKNGIPAAQQIDVLKVARTLSTQQEYACNGFVLNPVDATKIETLKGNDDHYLEVMRDGQGILRISGIPVVETTAMPAGKFAAGDWALAAALYEFTQLTLEFSESTQQKLENSVYAIVQEEVLFPIYNKYMFVVGDFTTAKDAIDKPV